MHLLLFTSLFAASIAHADCTATVEADLPFPALQQIKSDLLRANDHGVLYTSQNTGSLAYTDLNGSTQVIDTDIAPTISEPFLLNNGNIALGASAGRLKIFTPDFKLLTTFNTGLNHAIHGGIQLKNGNIVADTYQGWIYFFKPDGQVINVFRTNWYGDSIRAFQRFTELSDGNVLLTLMNFDDHVDASLAAILDPNGNPVQQMKQVDLNQFTKIEETSPGIIALNGISPSAHAGYVEFFDYQNQKAVSSISYAANEYPTYVKALGNGSSMVLAEERPYRGVRFEFYDSQFQKISESRFNQSGVDLEWHAAMIGPNTVAVSAGRRILFFSTTGELKLDLALPDLFLSAPIVISQNRLAFKTFHGSIQFISHHCSQY